MNAGFGRAIRLEYFSGGESSKGIKLNHKFMVGKRDFYKETRLERRMSFLKEKEI